MEKRARRSIFKILILILAILLIGITIQQYFRYTQERSRLESSINRMRKYLIRARNLEANSEKVKANPFKTMNCIVTIVKPVLKKTG